MFKVTIRKPNESEPFSREIFNDIDHARNWIEQERLKTGFIYSDPFDIKLDPEWEEIKVKKIKKESPSVEEIVEALILKERGKPNKLAQIISRLEAVEDKYK